MRIELKNLTAGYFETDSHPIVDNLTLGFQSQEMVAILGPSGCGKTCLLKSIAGLIPIQSGTIEFPDYQSSDRPSCRMAFQDHCLFPWLTVVENIAIGLEAKGIPKAEREARALEKLGKIGLEKIARKLPNELSGGMKQRVALLRLLVSDGDILLFDEPLSAVDAQTRLFLQQELLDLWSADPKTSIYITHDIEEALILADRVIVLSATGGKVLADIKVPGVKPRVATAQRPKVLEDLRWEIWSLLADPIHAPPALSIVAS